MNVAWSLSWAGSRSTKLCVFQCKVAAASDERYLVCAAGAGWVRPRFGVVRTVVAASMRFVYSCTLQLHGVLESLLAKRIVMAAWLLHGAWLGREAGARNRAFFRVKWLPPATKGTSCARRVRAGFGQGSEWSALSWLLRCVLFILAHCSYMVFWNLCLRNAL